MKLLKAGHTSKRKFWLLSTLSSLLLQCEQHPRVAPVAPTQLHKGLKCESKKKKKRKNITRVRQSTDSCITIPVLSYTTSVGTRKPAGCPMNYTEGAAFILFARLCHTRSGTLTIFMCYCIGWTRVIFTCYLEPFRVELYRQYSCIVISAGSIFMSYWNLEQTRRTVTLIHKTGLGPTAIMQPWIFSVLIIHVEVSCCLPSPNLTRGSPYPQLSSPGGGCFLDILQHKAKWQLH